MTSVHNVESIPAEQLSGTHCNRSMLAVWSESRAELLPWSESLPEDAEFRTVRIRSIEHDRHGVTTVTVTQEWGDPIPLDYEATETIALIITES